MPPIRNHHYHHRISRPAFRLDTKSITLILTDTNTPKRPFRCSGKLIRSKSLWWWSFYPKSVQRSFDISPLFNPANESEWCWWCWLALSQQISFNNLIKYTRSVFHLIRMNSPLPLALVAWESVSWGLQEKERKRMLLLNPARTVMKRYTSMSAVQNNQVFVLTAVMSREPAWPELKQYCFHTSVCFNSVNKVQTCVMSHELL